MNVVWYVQRAQLLASKQAKHWQRTEGKRERERKRGEREILIIIIIIIIIIIL